MQSVLKDNSGFALILTILILSLLMVLTFQFNSSMWSGLYSSANLRDGIRLGFIARSGLNCAFAVLSEDAFESDYDSLQEPWAHSKELSLNSVAMFENSRFQVEISDLSGRIQINRLIGENGKYDEAQKKLLTKFLSSQQFRLSSEEVENLIDAIKDWVDPDDDVTRFGAENGYYQSLENPYSCKNGPVESLGEMLLIKGMTEERFFGGEHGPGISNYLTIYGDGKININTADPLILSALSDDIDTEMVRDMAAYRLDERNDLKDPGWHRKVAGMGHVTIEPALIKTSSTYFEIESAGIEGTMNKKVAAVIKREEGKPIQILAWKVE
ncbi:MAG: type II secretion system minor pseudopilin GspK [Proteobacteria bacterium]|nr:type II secretion system minor pseudopilin GspK [Pseudomonadota bacterium]